MLKLTIVVATVLLNVVKAQPINVNVDVTVNGVKVPISQELPQPTDLNHRSGIIDSGFGGIPAVGRRPLNMATPIVSFRFLALICNATSQAFLNT